MTHVLEARNLHKELKVGQAQLAAAPPQGP